MTKSERFIKEIGHHQEGMTASTRREESLDLICRQLQDACQTAGDIPNYIEHTLRFIENVKAGKVVIELGSE
jgi:proline dehydrogenase